MLTECSGLWVLLPRGGGYQPPLSGHVNLMFRVVGSATERKGIPPPSLLVDMLTECLGLLVLLPREGGYHPPPLLVEMLTELLGLWILIPRGGG